MFSSVRNTNLFKKFKPIHRLARTITILADGNGNNQNNFLRAGMILNFENKNSVVPYKQLNKITVKDYEYPIIKFQYNRNDVVEHALSVGVEKEDPFASNFLDFDSSHLQVLPSFPFPLTNKILLDVAQESLMSKLLTLHGEHYIEMVSPIPPEGIIDLKIETFDVVDKGSGTLYCWRMNGHQSNRILFKSEYKMFEVGTGGWSRANIVEPLNFSRPKPKESVSKSKNPGKPDAILEFQTTSLIDGVYRDLTDFDLQTCIYSHKHPRQYYSRYDKLHSNPICHGRYFFGGTLQKIIGHYAQGNSHKFKSAKVRFTEPVFPGELIEIRTWKSKEIDDNNLFFEAYVRRGDKDMVKVVNVMRNGTVILND